MSTLEQLLADLVEAGYRPAVKTHILVPVETIERMESEGWTILPDGHAMGWVIDAHRATAHTKNEHNIIGATCPTLAKAIEYTRREMQKYGIGR